MKVALCVGHSRKIRGRVDGGAVSVGNVSEHDFNSEIAELVKEKLKPFGVQAVIFDTYRGAGYTSAMKAVAADIKAYGADIAVELHFNASDDPKSNGYEYLCWHTSKNGKRLATLLLSEHGRVFKKASARGVVNIDSVDDRGGAYLLNTHCPAVICEPFFGSNDKEWGLYSDNMEGLADVYANAIVKYFNK